MQSWHGIYSKAGRWVALHQYMSMALESALPFYLRWRMARPSEVWLSSLVPECWQVAPSSGGGETSSQHHLHRVQGRPRLLGVEGQVSCCLHSPVQSEIKMWALPAAHLPLPHQVPHFASIRDTFASLVHLAHHWPHITVLMPQMLTGYVQLTEQHNFSKISNQSTSANPKRTRSALKWTIAYQVVKRLAPHVRSESRDSAGHMD